jgi:hypothetical protein
MIKTTKQTNPFPKYIREEVEFMELEHTLKLDKPEDYPQCG